MPQRQDSKSLTKARKAAAAKQKRSNRSMVDEVADTSSLTEQISSPVEVDVPTAIGRPD